MIGSIKIWVITDTHFGHDMLIEYCGRPVNFSELILENLHSMVDENSVLIHLGDICIGHDQEWHTKLMESLYLVKKILVRGNHDKKSNKWYLEHGWDVVCENITLKVDGKIIMFSHLPLSATENFYHLNIHGHFHNKEHRNQTPEMLAIANDKQRLIAIENTKYKPVLLSTLLKNEVQKIRQNNLH